MIYDHHDEMKALVPASTIPRAITVNKVHVNRVDFSVRLHYGTRTYMHIAQVYPGITYYLLISNPWSI